MNIVVDHLTWDAENRAHIAQHGVTPEEVEEAVYQDPNQAILESYRDRLVVIGQSARQRMLAVILAPEGGDVYYVVTAYDSNEDEQRLYHEQRGGEIS